VAWKPQSIGWAQTTGSSCRQEHFANCQFGDKRLTYRAVKTADALLAHPAGTPPAKLSNAHLLTNLPTARCWMELQRLVEGAQLARLERSG
jgi:hypothetical protein